VNNTGAMKTLNTLAVDRGWSSSLVVGSGLTNPDRKTN